MTDLGTASFTSMDGITQEDWDIIIRHHDAHYAGGALVAEVLDLLERLKGPKLGFQVDRYEHSLQSATRALRAGEDEEVVVCALLHDVGDLLAPENHCEVATAMLRPYVSPENLWMVEKHVVFTGYYFFHLCGLDRDEHRKLKGHPAYERTMRFVRDYDCPSFDPAYDTLPLSVFEPMVRRLFARRPRSAWREMDEAAAGAVAG
ncbi:MAG: HD domain-containing protein [Dongiaceae bacterium]